MKFRVVYYGRLKESTGTKIEDFEISESEITVRALVSRLVNCYPALREQLDTVVYTIGAELVPPDAPIRDGDEVGFLPPVSGG